MSEVNEPNELSPALPTVTYNKPATTAAAAQPEPEIIIQPNQITIEKDSKPQSPVSQDFDNQLICKKFIRIVYIILLCQFILALVILVILTTHDDTKQWLDENNYVMWIALLLFIVTISPMLLCNNIRRKKPIDIIVLIIFTIVHSILLAFMLRLFGPNVLLISVGITSAVHIGFILFTFQKKINFSGWISAILILAIVGIIFGISAIFLYEDLVPMICASIASILYSFYVIFDLKLMIDNEHEYSVKPNEYCFAAVNLYLDPINLFIYMFKKIFHCLFDAPAQSRGSARNK